MDFSFSKNRRFSGAVLAGVLLVTKAEGAICQCQTSERLINSLTSKKQVDKVVWNNLYLFGKAFVITLGIVGILALLLFVTKKVVARIIAEKVGVYNKDPFQSTLENNALKMFEEAEEAERENEEIKRNFKEIGIDINEYYEKKFGYIPVDGDYRNPTPLNNNQVPEVNDNNEESGRLSNQIIIDGVQNIDYNKLEGLTEEEKKFINFLENAVLKGNNEKEDNNNIVNDEEVVLFKVRNSSGNLEEKMIELYMLQNVLLESAEKWSKYRSGQDLESIDFNLEEEDFTSFINLFSKLLFENGILISYKDREGLWNYFKDEDIEIDYDSLEGLTSQERHFIRFLQSKKGEEKVELSVCNKSDKENCNESDKKRPERIQLFSNDLKRSLNQAARKWRDTEDKGNMSFIDLLSSEIPSLKGVKKTFKETTYKKVDGKFVPETVEKTEIAEDKVVFSYEDDGKIFLLKEEFMVDYRDLLNLSDEERNFVYFLNTTKEKSVRGQIYDCQEDKGLEEKDFNVEDLKTALRETADIWIKENGVVKDQSGFNGVSFIELFSSKCEALNGKTLISYKDNIEDWQFFYIKLEGLTDNESEFLRLLQNKGEGNEVNIKVKTGLSGYKEVKEEIVEIKKPTIANLKQAARNWMNTENKANLSFIELLSKELFYREDILISYEDDGEWKSLEDGSEINGKSFEKDKNEDNLLNKTFSSTSDEN